MSSLIGLSGTKDSVAGLGGVDRFNAQNRPLSTGWLGFSGISSVTEVIGVGLSNWDIGYAVGVYLQGISEASYGPFNYTQFTTELWCQKLAAMTIPATATITGIRAKYKVRQDSGSGGTTAAWADNRLVVGGAWVGNQMVPSSQSPAYSDVLSVDVLQDYIFGSPSNLWGLSAGVLTPAIVQADDFGVKFQFFSGASGNNIVKVDYVAINIFYTV